MKRFALLALLTLTVLAACAPAPEPAVTPTDTLVPSTVPEPTAEPTATESGPTVPDFYVGDESYSSEQLSSGGWQQAEALKAALFQQLVADGAISPNESGDYSDIVRFHPVLSEDNSFGSLYVEIYDDAVGQWTYMAPRNLVDDEVELLTLLPSDGHEIVIEENTDGWPVLGENDELWNSEWMIVDEALLDAPIDDSFVLDPTGEWVNISPLERAKFAAKEGEVLDFDAETGKYVIVNAELGEVVWILDEEGAWQPTEKPYETSEEVAERLGINEEEYTQYGHHIVDGRIQDGTGFVIVQDETSIEALRRELHANKSEYSEMNVGGAEFILQEYVRAFGFESLEAYKEAHEKGEVEPIVLPGFWNIRHEVVLNPEEPILIKISGAPDYPHGHPITTNMQELLSWTDGWVKMAVSFGGVEDLYYRLFFTENGGVGIELGTDGHYATVYNTTKEKYIQRQIYAGLTILQKTILDHGGLAHLNIGMYENTDNHNMPSKFEDEGAVTYPAFVVVKEDETE